MDNFVCLHSQSFKKLTGCKGWDLAHYWGCQRALLQQWGNKGLPEDAPEDSDRPIHTLRQMFPFGGREGSTTRSLGTQQSESSTNPAIPTYSVEETHHSRLIRTTSCWHTWVLSCTWRAAAEGSSFVGYMTFLPIPQSSSQMQSGFSKRAQSFGIFLQNFLAPLSTAVLK